MSLLRILIYPHAFAPKIGGVETYVMRLAQGLARRQQPNLGGDVQVIVATPTPVGGMNDALLPFRVVREPSLRELVRLVRGTDVIHLAGPAFLPMFFGLIFGKPVVVEHDGYQVSCPNGLLLDERTRTVCPGHYMAGRYLECLRCNTGNVGGTKSLTMLLLTFPRRWMCARVARNIYPSNHVGRRVMLPRGASIFHGTPDTDGLLQEIPQISSCPAWFVFVGRLVPEKGVSVLLRAGEILVKHGYDIRLKIIGDGPARPALEELAKLCGLQSRTVFTGGLRGDALQEALSGCSASVMPSTWEDVAPLAAIEHLIQGRVLIASDIGGLGELVDEAGLRFPPGDAESLASCMRLVLDEPELAKGLRAKARKRALELFREDRMVAEHLALYREVTKN